MPVSWASGQRSRSKRRRVAGTAAEIHRPLDALERNPRQKLARRASPLVTELQVLGIVPERHDARE